MIPLGPRFAVEAWNKIIAIAMDAKHGTGRPCSKEEVHQLQWSVCSDIPAIVGFATVHCTQMVTVLVRQCASGCGHVLQVAEVDLVGYVVLLIVLGLGTLVFGSYDVS